MLSNLMIILMTVSCFYRLPLVVVVFIFLCATVLSGYMAPKYQTEIIQNVAEEQLTRVFSLNNFILMLSAPLGFLQATLVIQFGFFISLLRYLLSWHKS